MDSDQLTQQSPRRVAIYTFSYAPLMTGISAVVHERIEVLLRMGHSVHLVHPDTSQRRISSNGMYGLSGLHKLGNFTSATFPTVNNPLRRSWPEAASHRVWNDTEKLMGFQPDLILVDDAAGLFGASSVCLGGFKKSVGVECGNRLGIPVINLIHGDWRTCAEAYVGRFAVSLGWPMIKRIMRPVTTEYDLNLSPSQYLRHRYDDFYHHRIEHVHFVGVDCEAFKPLNASHNPAIETDAPIIVNSGRVVHEKNILDLMAAFRDVRQHVPNARLVILGDGPLLRKVRRIGTANFGDSVITPGAVFGDTLKWWLARADVYWTASLAENFSVGILEALASGTPVVTYAAGGNVEQVEHEVSGLHCEPRRAADLALQTVRLLDDEKFRLQLSHGARRRALTFSNERCVQRLLTRVLGDTGPVQSEDVKKSAA